MVRKGVTLSAKNAAKSAGAGLAVMITATTVILMAGCMAPKTFEIAWNMEGTLTFQEGYDVEEASLKLGAFLSDDYYYGYYGDIYYSGLRVSNVQEITDGGSFALAIDLIDIDYGAVGDEVVAIYVWDDGNDNDYPDTNEESFYVTAASGSGYFDDGSAVFSYIDSRGWTTGYYYGGGLFTYGGSGPAIIENGITMSGVELTVPYYDDYYYE